MIKFLKIILRKVLTGFVGRRIVRFFVADAVKKNEADSITQLVRIFDNFS